MSGKLPARLAQSARIVPDLMVAQIGTFGEGNRVTETARNTRARGEVRIADGPGRARLRCYAELNDGLPARWRQRDMPLAFEPPLSVAALLEALGIPAAAVELILVDGASAGLHAPVPEGAQISLYPVFERFDVSPLARLRDAPLRETRFLCDSHLGKLARRLRLLGFDTLLAQDITGEDPGDAALARITREQHRILLTRDQELLARPELTHALEVQQAPVEAQLQDLVGRLQLSGSAAPFTRCTCCNALVETTSPAELSTVPKGVLRRQARFWRCPGCGRIYWQGGHHRRMRELVDRLLAD